VIQFNKPADSLRLPGGVSRLHKSASPSNQIGVAFLFLLPAIIALLVMRLIPAGFSFYESLNKTNVFTNERSFIGFTNYIELFRNPEFVNTIKVTLLFTLLVNPIQIIIATALAILFSRKFPLSGLFRSFIIFPIAVPPAVSAVVWSAIYRPDGLANALLKSVGVSSQPWIISSDQSLMSIIILLSWIGCGYWMLFLIAGINDIPSEVYEASKIDGAGFLRQTFSITLPLIKRSLTFVLVADTVSNFLIFAPVSILTNGGPDGSTSLLMFDIFTRAYSYGDVGKSAAAVFILVVLMLIAIVAQFRLLRSKE
jgi:multiple sugar transport system permease protein